MDRLVFSCSNQFFFFVNDIDYMSCYLIFQLSTINLCLLVRNLDFSSQKSNSICCFMAGTLDLVVQSHTDLLKILPLLLQGSSRKVELSLTTTW